MIKYKVKIFRQTFSDPELEKNYEQQIYLSSLSLVRWTLFGAIFLHCLLMITDAIVLDDYTRYQFIRLYILVPGAILLFLESFLRSLRSIIQYLYASAIIVNGVCVSAGTLMYGEQYIMYWSSGAVIVIIFASMLMGLRFILALSVIWINTILQLSAILLIKSDITLATSAIITTFTSAVLLSVGSYVIERTNRESFLRSQELLDNEKLRIETEQSRLEWLEQIAGFLRHELRNAMNGARTSLELIKRGGELDKTQKYIERGNRSIVTMSELLNSVSDATSLESSFYKEKPRRFVLSKVVADYFDNCCEDYPNIEFKYDCDSDPHDFEFIGREERIIQMLDKIIENAIDHSDGAAPIMVNCCYSRDQAKIDISNTGKALPENKERMFDLFGSFRENIQPGTKRGYGLYVARLIAEHYKGTVNAFDLSHSTGATFTITLPAIP